MIYYLPVYDNILFFIGHKNVQVGSGSSVTWTSGSGSESQDYGPAYLDPNRNIYGSTTLDFKFGLVF
jgi:hypothetical protein